MKFCFRKALSIAAVFSFLMLAACFEPSAEETGEGYFTINLNVGENMRAVYPPTDTSDLRFVARFKETASGAERTYTSDGSKSIQGKIDTGNYIVTLDVSLISDGSLYARGVGYDNPVKIGSGKNQVKVHAFDVKNAEPPVISAKPQGRTYSFGDTKPALEVSASVKDSGVISYQWYSNTSNSNSGGTAIAGATLSSYMPSTTTPGTTWHYVAVTNTSTGKPTTISTVPVAIVVGANPDPGPGTEPQPVPGTGTVNDPFLVYDVASLQKVGSGKDGWSLSAHYKQTADIDLSTVPKWTPIGIVQISDGADTTYAFKGRYDGNGHTINNFTNVPNDELQGLFGWVGESAVVKNVGVVNCAIIGDSGIGGLVIINEGTIQNCYVTGRVSVNTPYTHNGGGGVLVPTTGYGGGVVGINQGTVQNCYTTSNVSGYSATDHSSIYLGGVVGANIGTVQNCYATGNISSSNEEDPNTVGGVVGMNLGIVQNCVALNLNISGNTSDTNIRRVVGYNPSGTLANNYGRSDMKKNDGSPAWTNNAPDQEDGADVGASQYNNQTWWRSASGTGPGFDFTNVWAWGSNNLPILRNMPGTATQNPAVK